MIEFIRGNPEQRAARQTIKGLKELEKVKELNNRQQAALGKAQGITRRLLLQRLLAGTVAVGFGGIPVLLSLKEGEQAVPSWLTVEEGDVLGEERVKAAVQAAKDWDAKYKRGGPITIRPLDAKEREVLPSGEVITILEQAESGDIRLSQEGDPRNNILHAMTHASKPAQPTFLSSPIPYADGVVRGFHGLFILVNLDKDGKDTNFKILEEGMAERNAAAFQGYTVTDGRYFNIGTLTRELFPFDKYSQAHEWGKHNDVPSLMRARFNLPADAVLTGDHFSQLIAEYADAWNRRG